MMSFIERFLTGLLVVLFFAGGLLVTPADTAAGAVYFVGAGLMLGLRIVVRRVGGDG